MFNDKSFAGHNMCMVCPVDLSEIYGHMLNDLHDRIMRHADVMNRKFKNWLLQSQTVQITQVKSIACLTPK